MPPLKKKFVKRKFATKKKTTRRKSKATGNNVTATTVTFMSKPINQLGPLPQKYRTRFFCTAKGDITTAIGATSFQLNTRLNCLVLPFSISNLAWPGLSPASGSLDPTGFSTLINLNAYTRVRVIKSYISIMFDSLATTDVVLCTITPTPQTAATFPTLPNNPLTTSQAIGMTNTRSKQWTPFSQPTQKSVWLNHSCTQAACIGVPQKAIDYDLSGQYTHFYNQAPATPLYWNINIQNMALANFTGSLPYMVKLMWDVELYNNDWATSPES